MKPILIEKKSGVVFEADCYSDDLFMLFKASFENEEFKSQHGEPAVEVIDSYKVEKAIQERMSAYRTESDPLYMEWQYDQTPESKQIWMDKVVEIKARYPLPTA
ncbi:hypothetical protein CWB89_13980 [Pseudoalteromonas piscicida]|uniref:Uncharacterized protein n=1 Tax=Pseudoalteromonas piscicida TaxID=43662 RepID=A0AAQ2EPN6_PSEO7|nr:MULTISPECIES: hypothetical protein [Pseudoalteromonas]KJY85637.1 hypothetical protein TW75_19860 [Pseudoalteromonas piscicida]TMN34906.1 hypothetical protein CWB94_22020 [Pseudoalteromonas piscicida]TMN39023.1 hypothetical protein CWB95_13155 [Pseudoalteromonas piscicida]TMN49558.1 hypothetical protein CWB91_16340 [Pseudoalteromonas piscicida]TMN50136.1 hypothetical protein CWB93_21110 [Pseudoalteromonas piscicida]